MVGGTLLTLVALTTGEGSWWQAVTMLMVILAWLTLEGYVIAPMVYGRAVRFDPVMVLVATVLWLVVGAAGDGHGAACHGHAAGAGDHVSRDPRTRCSDGTPPVGHDLTRRISAVSH